MNTPEIPTEWEALNDLEQGIYKLQNATDLFHVVNSSVSEFRSHVIEGALYALLALIEDCAKELGEANKTLWTLYRRRNDLPDPNAEFDYEAAAARLKKAAKSFNSALDEAASSKPKLKPKRKKSNVKK